MTLRQPHIGRWLGCPPSSSARSLPRSHGFAAQGLLVLSMLLGGIDSTQAAEPVMDVAECRSALALVPGLSGDRRIEPRSPQRPLIGLGSGPGGQTYHDMADNLIELLAAIDGPALVNVETGGSFDNLSRLDSSFNMTLAFTQSDALEKATPSQQARLRWVASLYVEEVHVLAQRGYGQLAALDGKRIVVSRQSTGSAYTARRLLKLAGVNPQGGDVVELSPVEAVCQVLTGQAQAMVVVAGQPVRLFRDLERLQYHAASPLRSVHFLPIQPADLAPGRAPGISAKFYEGATIARNSYPWAFAAAGGAVGEAPAHHVATVGVRALLMAFDFSAGTSPDMVNSCNALRAVARVVQNPVHRARLCQVPNHPKWCQLMPAKPGDTVPGWTANACL